MVAATKVSPKCQDRLNAQALAYDAQLAVKDVEIQRLTELLNPPPPTMPKLLIGVAGYPNEAEYEAFDAEFGPHGIRRTYENNIPSTFMQSQYAGADVGKRASWTSVRAPWGEVAAGLWDTRIAAYARSWPRTHPGLCTYSHEPENDGSDPKMFVAATKQFYKIARPLMPDCVKIGPISMGWTMDPTNHTTVRADYFDQLTSDDMDFGGLDVYNPYHFPPAKNDPRWWPAPMARLTSFIDWCEARNVPPAIGETGSAEDTTQASGWVDGVLAKIDWVDNSIEAMEEAKGVAYVYFDTLINHDYDPTAMINAQPAFAAYWKTITAKYAVSV